MIRLLVDDEPFDVRYGEPGRATSACSTSAPACCGATADWRSPAGQRVRVTSTRLVSFAQRAVAAIRYEVEPRRRPPPASSLQSELVANEPLPPQLRRSARRGRARGRRWSPSRPSIDDLRRPARPLDHAAACGWRPRWTTWSRARPAPRRSSREHRGRGARDRHRRPGSRASACGSSSSSAYGWSAQRSVPAMRDQVRAALVEARHTGWDGLLAAQREYLDDFWERADVEIEGDAELQQAVRFALFHCLQAGARAERRAIPAKGLTGPGLRRPHLLGHRDLRAAGAHLHGARGGCATRCAGAGRRSTWRASARRSSAWRAPPSPGGRSAAQECSALLARRHRRLPHQRRHRRRRGRAT